MTACFVNSGARAHRDRTRDTRCGVHGGCNFAVSLPRDSDFFCQIDTLPSSQSSPSRIRSSFQITVVCFLDESLECPIGRQRFGDIEAAVIRDEAVVIKKVPQIGDIAEALAFHDDTRTEHCLLRKAGTAAFYIFGVIFSLDHS